MLYAPTLASCSVPLQPVLVAMETGVLTNASGKCQVEQSKVDDVVLIRDENAPRKVWPTGVVTKVEPDSKGLVRSVVLRTHTTKLHRPVNKLILMLTAEERMDATQGIEEAADKLVQSYKPNLYLVKSFP